jgi:hypothetical protein
MTSVACPTRSLVYVAGIVDQAVLGQVFSCCFRLFIHLLHRSLHNCLIDVCRQLISLRDAVSLLYIQLNVLIPVSFTYIRKLMMKMYERLVSKFD